MALHFYYDRSISHHGPVSNCYAGKGQCIATDPDAVTDNFISLRGQMTTQIYLFAIVLIKRIRSYSINTMIATNHNCYNICNGNALSYYQICTATGE